MARPLMSTSVHRSLVEGSRHDRVDLARSRERAGLDDKAVCAVSGSGADFSVRHRIE
jgi:hypothetical protein